MLNDASPEPVGTEKHARADLEPAEPALRFGSTSHGRRLSFLDPTRVGGLYALVAMIILFSILSPKTFPRADTLWQILNSNAVPALPALALVIPLACGVFDLSVPNTMSLAGVISTYSIVNNHSSVVVGIALALGAAALVGLLNTIVVVIGKIQSLIATLATGFVVQSVVLWRTNSQSITGVALNHGFRRIGYSVPFGRATVPVIYVAVEAFVIWFVLERTASGRRMYATGFSVEAARLAGVPTARLRATTLFTSAILAGVAGIVVASAVGSGSPTAGADYLLPAFAGVFVGATQFRPGRFNAWGTVLAIFLLGTLTTGLGLVSVPQWGQQLATGLALIAALVLASHERKSAGRGKAAAPD